MALWLKHTSQQHGSIPAWGTLASCHTPPPLYIQTADYPIKSQTSPWPFSFCQFFVEDPGGSLEDVLTTAPPEVLTTTPPALQIITELVNRSNVSLLDYREEDTGENKFYLPVSTKGHIMGWICEWQIMMISVQKLFKWDEMYLKLQNVIDLIIDIFIFAYYVCAQHQQLINELTKTLKAAAELITTTSSILTLHTFHSPNNNDNNNRYTPLVACLFNFY